jgi:hypothetical protein
MLRARTPGFQPVVQVRIGYMEQGPEPMPFGPWPQRQNEAAYPIIAPDPTTESKVMHFGSFVAAAPPKSNFKPFAKQQKTNTAIFHRSGRIGSRGLLAPRRIKDVYKLYF